MPFTVPNAAAAAYPSQASLDSGDLQVATAAAYRQGVVAGCQVTAQATPDMTVNVNYGMVAFPYFGHLHVPTATATITAANGTNPRHDLIVAKTDGSVAVITGTPAAYVAGTSEPVFAAIPTDRIVLAVVYVPPAVTAITSTMVTDKRVLLPHAGYEPLVGRIGWLWPFTSDSPWNLPIATTATYEKATDARTANYIATSTSVGTINPWISYTGYNMPFSKASLTDPLATMTDTGDSSRSDVFRIPANAPIATGTDGPMGIITPDGRFLHETWQTHRNSPTDYTCAKHVKSDIYGRGIGPGQGIHANGSSIIGGVIREWEVYGGPEGYGEIRHVLGMAIDGTQLWFNSGAGSGYGIDDYQRGTPANIGYAWPATEQDFDCQTSYTGLVPMGSLAAIPRWVDLTTLGLSPAGLVIARACQKYGLLVVDRSGATWGLGCDESIAFTRWDDWLQPALNDVGIIRAQCRLVTNNSKYTPGGGVWTGDARNRLAPIAPNLPPAPSGRPS